MYVYVCIYISLQYAHIVSVMYFATYTAAGPTCYVIAAWQLQTYCGVVMGAGVPCRVWDSEMERERVSLERSYDLSANSVSLTASMFQFKMRGGCSQIEKRTNEWLKLLSRTEDLLLMNASLIVVVQDRCVGRIVYLRSFHFIQQSLIGRLDCSMRKKMSNFTSFGLFSKGHNADMFISVKL